MSNLELTVDLLTRIKFDKNKMYKDVSGVAKDMAKHFAAINTNSFSNYFSNFKNPAKNFIDKKIFSKASTLAHSQDLKEMYSFILEGLDTPALKALFPQYFKGRGKALKKRLNTKELNEAAESLTSETMWYERKDEIEEENKRQKRIKNILSINKQEQKQQNERIKETVSSLTTKKPIFKSYKQFYQQQEREAVAKQREENKKRQRAYASGQILFNERVVPYTKGITKQINDIVGDYSKKDKRTIALGNVLEKAIISSSKQTSKQQQKDSKQKQEEENRRRKKMWNFLLGKWATLGVGGLFGAKVFGYIGSIASSINQTAQQGLKWQRTIEGGAGGGFGAGLANFQRAGLSGDQFNQFRRGLQYKVGQIKLGMGDASPFTYYGIDVNSNIKSIQKQIIARLKTLPEEIALVAGNAFGLDWDTVVAARQGKLDKDVDGYKEEAIRKMSNTAEIINSIATGANVTAYNSLSGLINSFVGGKTSGNWITDLLKFGHLGYNVFSDLTNRAATNIAVNLFIKDGKVENSTATSSNGDVINFQATSQQLQ